MGWGVVALVEEVETHIHNDGLQWGVEMYFVSLVRQSTLALELTDVKSNIDAQANLDTVKAERKTLMEKLDQVCDSVASIDNDLANAQKELMRVQA